MSWAYVPASPALNSEYTSSARRRDLCALSSGTNSAAACYGAHFPGVLFGTTFAASMACPGADLSIFLRPASPASLGRMQVRGGGSKIRAGSGPTLPESFAKFSPASSSWKTCLPLFDEADWPTFSGTWPRSGSMQSGVCFPAKIWKPRKSGSESLSWLTPTTENRGRAVETWSTPTASEGGGAYGNDSLKLDGQAALWPTPCAQENDRKNSTGPWMQLSRKVKGWPTPVVSQGGGNKSAGENAEFRPSLQGIARTWPTPTAQTYGNNQSPSPNAAVRPGLDSLARNWPTPLALDAEKTYDDRGGLGTLAHGHLAQRDPGSVSPGNYGQLNPRFVEWLMAFPDRWTAPDGHASEAWATALRLLLWRALGWSSARGSA